MIDFLMWNEGLLSGSLEGVGWLPLQFVACFSSSFLSSSHSHDLLLVVMEGGGLPPSERLSLRMKVSKFLRLCQTGQ